MMMPYLDNIHVKKDSVMSFAGLDRRPGAPDGSFINTKNLSSAEAPHLSPRRARGIYKSGSHPSGLMSGNKLCWTDGKCIVIDGAEYDIGLNDDPATRPEKRQLVSFGAYILIFPDKMWFNTADNTYGSIDAEVPLGPDAAIVFRPCRADGTIIEDSEITKSNVPPEDPTNGSYWFDTSEEPAVMKEYTAAGATFVAVQSTYIMITVGGEFDKKTFSPGDVFRISGLTGEPVKSLNGAHYVVSDHSQKLMSGNWMLQYVVPGIICEGFTETGVGGRVKVERKMPALDYIIESGNRLWGCRWGKDNGENFVNEIYASSLGDFRNWEVYQGVSTDSYRVTVGKPGKFTGAYTYRGYPHFFKESCVIKVHGAYPSAYQVQVTECEGVCDGCAGSLAVVGGYLYYKGRSGVYAFDGSLPYCVSAPLGDIIVTEQFTGNPVDTVAAGMGDLLYVRTKVLERAGGDGKNHLFVYDTGKNVWVEEDNVAAAEMCAHGGDIYFINGTNIISVKGKGDDSMENAVEWSAETNDMGVTTDERKYVSRLSVMMQLPVGSRLSLCISYDGGRSFERIFSAAGRDGFCHEVPMRIKRCEKFRLKFEGVGEVHIHGIVRYIEYGNAT